MSVRPVRGSDSKPGKDGRLGVARAKVTLSPGASLGQKAVSLPSLWPAAGNNVHVGYPSEKPVKRTPSQLLLEKQQFSLVSMLKPKITGFQDLALFSNHNTSVVPVDQPLFSVHPPVVGFMNFEGLQTYETTVTLRNQDTVARRVKVCPPDSPYFELLPMRKVAKSGLLASAEASRDKIAPGMEVSYVVRFKPDARIDYSYDLRVVTEREEFSVPIRASGGSALLDFPDVVDFGNDCTVGYQCERTVLVRNVGDRASKLLCRTTEPFSIDVPDGFLEEGASCQVSVFFTPPRAERYEVPLEIKYGEMECTAMLRGGACNAEVSLSHSLLLIEDTYVGLESQGVVTIRNDSEVPIDFSWRLFSSTVEEAQHRLALHRQLKTEEMDELLYMQQANFSEDEESDSGSDGERRRVRRERKVTKLLGRKYDSIVKAVEEDPMLFRDAIFKIEPLCGRLWPQTQVTCACCFLPKDALVYCATAYLSAVGQEDRAPLVLKGLGIGPKATFSYDELDVGNVFVESAHRYEVQLLNQGDIEVDFRLVHREGKFAPRFKFTPDHGTIAVGGQCEIVVDFKPKELGPFHEVFEWALQGSATAVTLAFRGTSVRPKFEFDVDKINFGTVSFGFLNSRMLTLTNTSEVPCYYTLTVKGDEAPPNNEFEIIPSRGTLLPNCAQRIQVDFISNTEKKYDTRLSVDLEGVGKELLSIPMFAQCAVPTVSFEPHGCLNYGDVFIRYPFHQSLYLHNTSVLPAKFMVETQEDKSKGEFEPDQWVGTVPPCASHVITVTLTAHTAGPLRIPMYVKIVGREVPFPLVLVGNSMGPRVVVDPPSLDFGNVKCLEPVTKHVRLTNFSCIDASVRGFMNERKSLWTVHPKVIHLSPQETLQLALSVRMDETCTAVDTLNLIVSEGDDLTVQVRCKGGATATDTPVTCDEELEFLDFGTIFTTQTCSREVVVKNHGQFGRRLAWAKEKEKDKKKNEKKEDLSLRRKKPQDEGVTIFRVEPEASLLDPKSAFRFTFMASSQNPGVVEDELVCTEIVEKGGGGKTIFRTRMRANFVAPQLKLSRNRIEFEFLWDKQRPISSITESLTLENTGPLEVRFTVQVQYPFSTDIEEGGIPPDGSQEILVDFDPGYKVDRKSGTVKQRMAIQYDEHPAVNMVDLVGKVVWPNIELDTHKIDFGTVLNDTSKKMEVRMTNPTVLSVAYRWCFALPNKGEKAEESSNPRTPGMLTVSGMDTRTSLGRMGGSVSGLSVHDADGVFAPSSPVSTSASWASLATSPSPDAQDVDLSQVFDILPIYGKLEPGETQVATFTYEALRDRSFRAVAVCMVDGGPEYEVALKGTAAPCKFSLDRTELDFGDIPFTEVGETELYLSNKGQVPASFNFNLSGVSRPFVVDVVPSNGVLKPEERLKVTVRFRAGIPDLVVETVLVEVAHFEATVLTVRGLGTFPGVVLDLPRKNEAEHKLQLDAAAKRLQMLPVVSSSASADERSEALDTQLFPSKPGSAVGFGRSKTASGVTDVVEPTLSARSQHPEVPAMETHDDTSVADFSQDFDLEFEVDRHYLCEVLLKSGGQTPAPSHRPPISPQRRKIGIDTSPVTAAYYVCDFGHIALGQMSTRKIVIHNCCSESVSLYLDKKLLRENGFLVEPDSIKPLAVGKNCMLQVSACRARDEAEGTLELEWNLPVRGGPNYKVQLLADFVLPDLVLSHESIDFGRLIVGRKKRVTIELQNTKAVPVEWAYVEPKDKYGRESVFDLVPATGILQPGERKLLTVSFAPIGAQTFSGILQIRMRDNQRRKSINVLGRGDVLRLEVRPSNSYQLGPVMPNSEGCSEEFWLVNPTDYPIEVFSTEFDQKYLAEERALADYDGWKQRGMAEVAVRQPGDGTWQEVATQVVQLRKQRIQEAQQAKEAAEAGDVTQPVPEDRDPAEVEKEAALQARADEELAALQAIVERPERQEMDSSLYPYRVKDGERVNAVLVGPPKSGMSSLARQMAKEDQRAILTMDDVIQWLKQGPDFLHDDWTARSIQRRLEGGRSLTVSEAAHVFKRRVELPDCNTGFILDGAFSSQLSPQEVLQVVLEAVPAEKVILITVDLPNTTETPPVEGVEDKEPQTAPEVDAHAPAAPAAPAPSAQGEALGQLYNALASGLKVHSQALRAQVPALEAVLKTAEANLAHAQAAEAAAALQATMDPAAEEEADVPPVDHQAALQEAKKAHFVAQRNLELLQAELESSESNQTWKPPEVEVDPETQAAIEAAKEAQQAAAKARAKSKPKPGDVPEEPEKPLADLAVEHVAKTYMDLQQLAVETFQRHNEHCRENEEERQREQERRRRQQKAAAQTAKEAQRRGPKGPPVEPIDLTASDYEPMMEDWHAPTEIQALAFCPLPFDEYAEPMREILPEPAIPTEPPLPPPSLVQSIVAPGDRPERVPLVNFSILTPSPAVCQPLHPSRVGSKEAAPATDAASATEEEVKETYTSETRWIIEPQSELRLLVHFTSSEVATYYNSLTFEVVDAVGSGPVSIGVSGVAALPGISSEPRLIFPRFKKRRAEDGYAVKAFVTSLGLYDFGPLLAGRNPSSRIIQVEDPPEAGGEELGASEAVATTEAQPQALSPFVLRHAENLRITNDSLFPANVRLGLASSGGDFAVGDLETISKSPSPFIVEPESLKLEVHQEAEVKIWCFPPEKGVYKDRIVARIEHNAEPVAFDLSALGEMPSISVDKEEVDFGRLMMNIRAEEQKVRIKNESAVAVRWQLLCKDSKAKAQAPSADEPSEEAASPEQAPSPRAGLPEEIGVEPREGQLSAHEEREIRFSFKSGHPAQFKNTLQLEARDAEGLNGWHQAANVSVAAESFAVDAVIEPDPSNVPLDFGTVLVHTSAQRIFEIVNRGRFPVRYELQIRRALREFLQIDKPKDELQPGERRAITVTCTPGRVFEAASEGIAVQIFDQLSGESVDHRIPPMRVTLTAVYNTFQVTPPRGLNFGPVEKGETQTRTFTIRNNGIFAFNWCLFDWADPPAIEEGQAPPTKPQVAVGPFTVKPTSGNLDPDEDVQVQVTFQATADEDYDSKLAIWVDGVQGEPAMDGTAQGCSSYLLTGQSCVPGINTVDLQTVFEEQFFTRTLEDAIALAGRLDVRVFSEADQIFHFGPVLVKERGVGSSQPASPTGSPPEFGVTENLRLTNPKAVPCKVQLSIKPREGDAASKAGGSSDAFEVFPQEVVISPHDSKQIQVKFTPTHLASFAAVLEAVVPQGTDPCSNYLSFELRGDGAVPSVSLQGPRIFGDEGGELDMGKLPLFRSNEVQMGLRNDGLLPATVRVDFSPSQHFTVACSSSVALNKGESRKFQVRFHPHSVGKVMADLGIRTLGNPFEDVTIQLQGEGHSSEVCWDLANVRRAGGVFGLRGRLEPMQDYVPPSPDELDLGEVPVGEEVKVDFKLNNSSSKPLQFEFISIPALGEAEVEPNSGILEANQQQTMTLKFRPADKLTANKEKILCKVANIDYIDDPEAPEGTERKHQEVEGTKQELPLQISVLADHAKLEADIEEINFLPTAMFCSKVYRFTLKNSSLLSVPFDWRIQGKLANAYTVKPSSGIIPAESEKEIEVHFAPNEVENFDCTLFGSSSMIDGGKPVIRLPLAGSALRPWCHLEVPASDYRSRRQSDAPLDPKYHILEIVSLGTHVKNTKRFYVMNPTAEPLDFIWQPEVPMFSSDGSGDDECFKCLTKRGTILPNKKFEMSFEFSPQSSHTKESFWSFVLLGPKVEEHFLVAGTVQEPRIGMDKPCINFGERLLQAVASESLLLVNKEHIPFSFQIDPASFQEEGGLQALSITPMTGVVGPDSSVTIHVNFKPLEERPFNFNIACNIKRKKEPVILNVKGLGYKIHASLAIEEPAGRRIINSGVVETLDMGMLQVHERREVVLYLRNDSKRNFNYRMQMLVGANRKPKPIGSFEKPPYIALSNSHGVAAHHEETPIELKYAPRDAHMLDGSILQVAIPAGPVEETFSIALTGGAKRSRVEFSFLSHDFGPCFIARGGATMAGEPFAPSEDMRYERVELIATNRDDSDCLISSSFQREPWLDVQLNAAMIEAGASLRIPIVFSPREVCEYMQRIEFIVNDYTRMHVDVRGRGCPLKLELTDSDMQNIDFGITRGNEPVSRQVRLVNRSPRPVTFQLSDEKELAEHAVSWTPAHPCTLRPRQTVEIELRFNPTYRIAPFRLPLLAKCEHGVEVRLLHMTGTCHAIEMRLSEHSVFFGDVVVGSQATKPVRLHNFGDLGAKFRFEIGSKYGKIFSVTPSEGFVRPQEDINLMVAFHPTHERIMEFKRADKHARKSKLDPKDMNIGITVRDIRCVLEGHPPLMLEASGKCVSQPGETKLLEFFAQVRTKTQNSFVIQNPTDSDWKLYPQVATQEPPGTNYFSCEKEIVVPAKKDATLQVYYMPLTMTAGDATGSPSSGKPRVEKHKGTIFLGTPDGNAVCYELEGEATPPEVNSRLEAKVPCKKKHTQAVPVKNWLHERQRFSVTVELVSPEPGSSQAQGISLQGVGTLDLPPGLEREYRFSVYAYHEGSALVRVHLTSQETGEFLNIEVKFDFFAAESLATIKLDAACRQVVRHKIAVANPLMQPARFTGSTSESFFRFSPETLEVPPRSEKTMELIYRPLEEGEGDAEVTLKSPELGTYPYTVNWRASPAGFERALVLKAPLGGSTVESFKFLHYAKEMVKYKARIEAAPGAPKGGVDFFLEASEVSATGCVNEPVPTELGVKFQPSMLGECRALLVISGPGGGEYKALLTGFAQPPQPQGPITMISGKQGLVEFRNPFDKPTDFSLQVDNPCFMVPMRTQRIDPQKSVQINVNFKSDRSQGGRLIISCDKVSTPWIFFLKGEV